MLKKTITYKDLDGNDVTEDFYFHLSEAELVEMEVSEKDGLAETMQKIVDSKDGAQIIEHFKKIILRSYGQRGEDGRQFIKNDATRAYFSQIGAYSILFMELATDAEAGAKFISGVLPANFSNEVQTKIVIAQTTLAAAPEPEPTDEFSNMSREELVAHMRSQASAIVPTTTETPVVPSE